MKTKISPRALRAIAAIMALALSARIVAAQDSTTTATKPAVNATSTAAPAIPNQAAPQLSFGVPDVLKLSNAKISEDTIVTYIQSSGRSYGGLGASEIVYLHEQGVSDRVVTTMLDQRKKLTEAAAQTTQQASAAPATTQANANTDQYPQAYVPPTVTYVQPEPVSTVYVIPNSPSYMDYGYYPSYGYYGYGYPAVSFGFGFGGYRGGVVRGGGFHRGGFHGGSGSHGGGGGSHGGGGGGSHGGGGGHHR